MRFTSLEIEVSDLRGAATGAQRVRVQLPRSPLVEFEQVQAAAVGADVVMALVPLPRWDQDPQFIVDLPEGVTTWEDLLTPLTDVSWFDSSGGPISPHVAVEDLPAPWDSPSTIVELAEEVGVAAP
jgi:hypothetical protein